MLRADLVGVVVAYLILFGVIAAIVALFLL
jgi:hypothetical protein